jgi:hypothetical protein
VATPVAAESAVTASGRRRGQRLVVKLVLSSASPVDRLIMDALDGVRLRARARHLRDLIACTLMARGTGVAAPNPIPSASPTKPTTATAKAASRLDGIHRFVSHFSIDVQ